MELISRIIWPFVRLLQYPFDKGADWQKIDDPRSESDSRKIAFTVGAVALLLSPTLLLISRANEGCFYDSISHYYYARYAGDVFVGALFFIGGVMLAYKSKSPVETGLAWLAAVCAIGTALFPTEEDGCELKEFKGRAFTEMTRTDDKLVSVFAKPEEAFATFPGVDALHFGFAGALFAILIVFCIAIFTIVFPAQRKSDGRVTKQKFRRNFAYITCGILMLLAGLAIAFRRKWGLDEAWNWDANNMTFVMETVMLMGFGFSWMLKGRFQYLWYIPLLWHIPQFFDEGYAARSQSR